MSYYSTEKEEHYKDVNTYQHILLHKIYRSFCMNFILKGLYNLSPPVLLSSVCIYLSCIVYMKHCDSIHSDLFVTCILYNIVYSIFYLLFFIY